MSEFNQKFPAKLKFYLKLNDNFEQVLPQTSICYKLIDVTAEARAANYNQAGYIYSYPGCFIKIENAQSNFLFYHVTFAIDILRKYIPQSRRAKRALIRGFFLMNISIITVKIAKQ